MANPKERGLDAAIDVTKFALAVAGAAIAFLVSSDTVKAIANGFERWTVTLAMAAFGISALSGLLVLLQGASKIADGDYDLSQNTLRIPGALNVLALCAGFLLATVFVVSLIWTADP